MSDLTYIVDGWRKDAEATWRIIYRVNADAIVILEVFNKKTAQTPTGVIGDCKRRLRQYDALH